MSKTFHIGTEPLKITIWQSRGNKTFCEPCSIRYMDRLAVQPRTAVFPCSKCFIFTNFMYYSGNDVIVIHEPDAYGIRIKSMKKVSGSVKRIYYPAIPDTDLC